MIIMSQKGFLSKLFIYMRKNHLAIFVFIISMLLSACANTGKFSSADTEEQFHDDLLKNLCVIIDTSQLEGTVSTLDITGYLKGTQVNHRDLSEEQKADFFSDLKDMLESKIGQVSLDKDEDCGLIITPIRLDICQSPDEDSVHANKPIVFNSSLQYNLKIEENLSNHTLNANGQDEVTTAEALPSILAGLFTLGASFKLEYNVHQSIALNRSIDSIIDTFENDFFKNKNIYAYAEQRKINKILPASLIVKLQFDDTHSLFPDNIIEAYEKTNITTFVTNRGEGKAFDVDLYIEAHNQDITCPPSIHVGSIQPGETKEISIPLTAGLSLPDGTANFQIIAREKRGYDSKPYNIKIQTASLEKPHLTIVGYRINDGNTGLASGNGNGIPENGETIELIPFIKNDGVGSAAKVKVGFDSINPGIHLVREQTEIEEILPGRTATGNLAFTIPPAYSGGEVNINLVASDVRKGVSEARKLLALNTATHRPALAYSYRIITSNGNGSIKNGEEGEIETTTSNNGEMEARDVSINLSSPYVRLQKKQENIPRISSNSKYPPVRFPFIVPRNLEQDSVDVHVEFAQRDFPGVTGNINIPVSIVMPDFEITHQILDPNSNGIIEQGEVVDVMVRVRNKGELDADNVRLEVDFDKEGVSFSGSKLFEIGHLAAGKTSRPLKLTFHITRRAEPGDFPLRFTLRQSDFPSRNFNLALNIAPEKAETITVAAKEKIERAMPVAMAPSANMPPTIALATPQDQKRVASAFETVSGVVVDAKGVASIEIRVNGKKVDSARGIGITAAGGSHGKRHFQVSVPLSFGRNVIEVTAFDIDNLSASERVTVYREAEKGEIYAAVIGINNYRNVPHLHYASNDARAFAQYLRDYMGLDSNHLFELYDQQATMRNIRSLLGTRLRLEADKPEDTVIIFFAGHGAPERDPTSPDGDSISKYILAQDSEMNDLFSTAIPMDEIARIFSRIRAERVVFIADSCYSGGSGGRTVLASGWRAANISDNFLDRIARAGKGRIILTSSSAREVSQESDRLGHGYFTYYLLEGLKGAADISHDGEIDVDEIYQYLNIRVAEATKGAQHPTKKGEAEGRVIIGRVR